MRLRHVSGASERILASLWVIKNPEELKGHYASLFHNDNPIDIEIGMGKGQFIIEMAKRHPDRNYIGIEMFDSVMVRALEKRELLELPNLYFIRGDAGEIGHWFCHEIDTIYLNFSDPWPKKRHAKRRLSSPLFLEHYDSIVKGKSHIVMKTDNRKLFEYSLVSYTNFGYQINEISLHLHEDAFKENVMTEYEERFVKRNERIYYIDVSKNK